MSKQLYPALLVFPAIVLLALACDASTIPLTVQPPTSAVATIVPPVTAGKLGRRTKTSGCVAANSMPDPACTPGAIFPDATVAKICTPGYSSSVRDVPSYIKARTYDEYGIASHEPGQYEVDHLVSLELGGSNSIANLWPEAADPRPGFHEKDKVENYLHDQVCGGKMSLQEAQVAEATNWLQFLPNIP
jgi:hypothetical protein